MNAEQLLDSKRATDIVAQFVATWRNKRASFGQKAKALQDVLDFANVDMRVTIPGVTPPKPAPVVQAPIVQPEQAPVPDALDPATTDENLKRIFELNPVPNPTQDQVIQSNLEARQGKIEQLKTFLPMQLGLGKRGNIVLPLDFPVRDLPSFLNEIGGFTVTDKEPQNLRLTPNLGINFDVATGQRTNTSKGPKDGWQVEIIRIP